MNTVGNHSHRAGAAADLTQLLCSWQRGDRQALDRIAPILEGELRQLARHLLRSERCGHTLRPTALVNEAYLKLIDQRQSWRNRAHFFGMAAHLMRRVLVDHARARARHKRGGGVCMLSLDESLAVAVEEADLDLVVLDAALERLAVHSPEECRVVELRYFAGLTISETAEVLGLSPGAVTRRWAFARAWLRRELDDTTCGDKTGACFHG
ncbi:sigma-70 family RNA polymerase sigma factor [Gloeobacter morelensis]|uniref:Sigma-70 family RNA polymerase sigma factor n=1 Tax=Gloeobacter morelensis MG652769 TaxID=2781736 RepID=A0ABY3PSD6_9CYAN|nr:sigma-70 family RNA polymerase sigma factor [Gloeobacter morelensis]UFP96647.1 sigma-70 family RNA polymerase sigma factor [Gloeobacter morelensis MG652769]